MNDTSDTGMSENGKAALNGHATFYRGVQS